MSIKIAGLMPIGATFPPRVHESLKQLYNLSDVVIVLTTNAFKVERPPRLEVVNVLNDEPWDDYTQRLTLLVRAAAHGCNWVLYLDDDETLEPGVTRDLLNLQIEAAEAQQCVAVTYAVREMWNEKQWRSDGLWNMKRRVILQKNPFMEKRVFWRETHLQRFHAFPVQEGFSLNVETQMLHWGMSTPELRVARQAKWERLDGDKKYQDIGYSYMTDESTLELTELKPTT